MYEDITSDDILGSISLFTEKKGKVKYEPIPTVYQRPNISSEAKFMQMYANDLAKYKEKNSKPKKSGRISSKDIPDSLPSNIKQFTLPDGSVVCVNTDETEMTEESVIDSITRTK